MMLRHNSKAAVGYCLCFFSCLFLICFDRMHMRLCSTQLSDVTHTQSKKCCFAKTRSVWEEKADMWHMTKGDVGKNNTSAGPPSAEKGFRKRNSKLTQLLWSEKESSGKISAVFWNIETTIIKVQLNTNLFWSWSMCTLISGVRF